MKQSFPQKQKNENYEPKSSQFLNNSGFQQGKFKNQTNINTVQSKIDNYGQKISKSEMQLKQLNLEYQEKEKLLKKLQEQQILKQKENSNQRYKYIQNNKKKIENDLEKKQKKISNFISQNIFLRKSIDDFRKEKNIYKNISEQIIKEIDCVTQQIQETDKRLKKLSDEKEQIQQKIIKQEKQNELESHITTVGYLTMQKKLQNVKFSSNQCSSKKLIPQQQTLTPIKNEKQNGLNLFITQTKQKDGEKTKLKYSSSKKGIFVQQQKQLQEQYKQEEQQLQQQLHEMDILMEKLYQETNTDNIEDLIKYYSNLEEQNLKYYKETKYLIEEIDKTKDKKLEMQMELKTLLENKANQKSLKENILKEMSEEYQQQEQKLKNLKFQKEDLKKTVNTLKISLQVILNRLNQNTEIDIEKENKIMQNIDVTNNLSKLEQKTNQILKLVKENNLEQKIFETTEQNILKLNENKQIKQYLNNINDLKKIYTADDEQQHHLLGPLELKKSMQKELDKILKKNEFKKIQIIQFINKQ